MKRPMTILKRREAAEHFEIYKADVQMQPLEIVKSCVPGGKTTYRANSSKIVKGSRINDWRGEIAQSPLSRVATMSS